MAYRLTDSGLPIFSVSPSSKPASRKNSRSCPSGTPNTNGSPQSKAFLIIPVGYFLSSSSPPRLRSEERRVGKECRSRRAPHHYKNEYIWHQDFTVHRAVPWRISNLESIS